MLKRIPRRNNITPVLRDVHWLKDIILYILLDTQGSYNTASSTYVI